MKLTVYEHVQKLCDLIEKRDTTWFIACAVIVALLTSWGI